MAGDVIGTTVDLNRGRHPAAPKRKVVDERDVTHARDRRHMLEQLAIQSCRRRGVVVLPRRRADRNGDSVVGCESEIDGLQLAKAADEQTRANEQDEGDGELCRDERTTHARVAACPDRAAKTAAQTGERRRARRA